LARVNVDPGDRVEAGRSVVARLFPASPPVLDVRERERARQAVQATEALLRSATATLESARTDNRVAEAGLQRGLKQMEIGTISENALEQLGQYAATALAKLESAEAAIAQRQAELASARAAFIDIESSGDDQDGAVDIVAPVTGKILRVLQESEGTVSAGTPILELGDPDGDLEVVVELLSSDAVQVQNGNRVMIENWGGEADLSGVVSRIDPFAFTKYSALGVEEQRVNTVIRLDEADDLPLGHGYRVDARIVVWEEDDVVIVPASALFREDGEWVVFRVEDGEARLTNVQVTRNNGVDASVAAGLQPGDQVVLYPSSNLEDGMRVASR
jgi:HlyD family secretion protein